jgi:hypothetical protein
MTRIRTRLTYANVMATLAFFIAVGGGAYAAATVGSNDVIDDSLQSEDLKNDKAVKSSDVKDLTLKGEDIAANSITGTEIDESQLYPSGGGAGQNSYQVPVGGLLSGQVRDIGAGGSTLYGSVTGISTASATFGDAATGVPTDTLEFGELRVKLAAPLTAGQSRTFSVVRRFDVGGSEFSTTVSCTIGDGEDTCSDSDHTQTNNPFLAIKIESTGAGLSATADAWYGLAVKQLMTE